MAQTRFREFSEGLPSAAFGKEYTVFDDERRIARLPRAPFAFLDRITSVQGPAFELRAGAKCEAQLDVRPDHWYFADNRQREMPFSVLLEAGLQPCGWLAAYCGSALASSTDLKFRNLGGRCTQHAPILQERDTLTTSVEMTNVAQSGGMIIQDFRFAMVSERHGPIYEGTTNFGFFSAQALDSQVGLRGHALAEAVGKASSPPPFDVPLRPPFPSRTMWMLDRIERVEIDGGEHGLGFAEGVSGVQPGAWFFAAHFFQDPVWPGSLGIEAFLQLLKVLAEERWGPSSRAEQAFSCVVAGHTHEWQYRGQVVPTCKEVRVRASVTDIDEPAQTLFADGVLIVDGLPIYSLTRFGLRYAPRGGAGR